MLPHAVPVELGGDGCRQGIAAGVVAPGQNALQHRRAGDEVAQAQAGRQDLRQRAQVDLVRIVVQRVQRRFHRPLVVHVAVAVVFDDRDLVTTRQLDELQAVGLRHHEPGRVLVGRDGVDEFRAAAGLIELDQLLLQSVQAHAFLRQGNAMHVELQAPIGRQRARIAVLL